jgi:hypothetical protein
LGIPAPYGESDPGDFRAGIAVILKLRLLRGGGKSKLHVHFAALLVGNLQPNSFRLPVFS